MTLTDAYQFIGRSNAVSSASGNNFYILLYAKTSGNGETGKHRVSVKMRMAGDSLTTFYGWRSDGGANVDGVSAFSWSNGYVPAGAWEQTSLTEGGVTYPRWVDLKEGYAEVEGTEGEVTIDASWVMRGSGQDWLPQKGVYAKVSASVTLTAPVTLKPSVPTLSAGTVAMLEKLTIYTNRESEALTHDLIYAVVGSTGTIARDVGDSWEWTVPDLVSKLVLGQTSVSCSILCITKNGDKVIGNRTVTVTLTLPGKSVPTMSADSVKMGSSVEIYTNRMSAGYTHKLEYAMGDTWGVIAEGVEEVTIWTPPKSLAAYTGNRIYGDCAITCKTYMGDISIGSSTVMLKLTVPDATVPVLSAGDLVLGESIEIRTPAEADCYEHDLSFELREENGLAAALTGTVALGVEEVCEWTPPLKEIAGAIPEAIRGTVTVSCVTRFKGSTTVVGDAQRVVFGISVPDCEETRPSVAIGFRPVSTLPEAFGGVYVAGKSGVKVELTVSSACSEVQRCVTEILGIRTEENPYTYPLLENSGTVTVTGRVTDARGYRTTVSGQIQVLPYGKPRVSPGEGQNDILCRRCNSDGTPDPAGAYLLVKAGKKYSKVESGQQLNFCRLTLRHKADAAAASAWSEPIVLLERDSESDCVSAVLPDVVPSNLTAYSIRLTASDDIGEENTVTLTVPSAFATFHIPTGGHGFTLGGYHDPGKYDVFDCRFDAEFQGDVSGRVYGLGALPYIAGGTDANDCTEFGVFGVQSDLAASTLVNFPCQKAGTLRVWSANGNGAGAESTIATIGQEYIPWDNSCIYRRFLKKAKTGWSYGTWGFSGGVDAVTEQGETDGWNWRKFENGTAECWRRVGQTVDVTSVAAQHYYGNCEQVAFPFAFADVPVVNTSLECAGGLLLGSVGVSTVTAPAAVRVFRPGTALSGAEITVAYHAIGRWK